MSQHVLYLFRIDADFRHQGLARRLAREIEGGIILDQYVNVSAFNAAFMRSTVPSSPIVLTHDRLPSRRNTTHLHTNLARGPKSLRLLFRLPRPLRILHRVRLTYSSLLLGRVAPYLVWPGPSRRRTTKTVMSSALTPYVVSLPL